MLNMILDMLFNYWMWCSGTVAVMFIIVYAAGLKPKTNTLFGALRLVVFAPVAVFIFAYLAIFNPQKLQRLWDDSSK
jgi:hypothetical protein